MSLSVNSIEPLNELIISYDIERPRPECWSLSSNLSVNINKIPCINHKQATDIINQCLSNLPKGPIKCMDGKISPPPKSELKESMDA